MREHASKFIAFVLLLLPGCATHPGYWSEESCEYCIKQNEHYIRVHKDEMVKQRLRRLELKCQTLEKMLEDQKHHLIARQAKRRSRS